MDSATKPERIRVPQVMNGELVFLTGKEVAALIRESLSSVYKMVEGGRIPAYKIGGRLIFDRTEILAWIRSRATMATLGNGKGRPLS
jgi:excisionase family DNA binding protein